MSEFSFLDRQVQWEGKFITAGVERFRFDQGAPYSRDKVWHLGAVGILAVDRRHVWLTRQPREVIGAQASLEIVAGKLDLKGEEPLQTGQRELAEEIGKRAGQWTELMNFYSSAGFTDERIWLFLATELSDSATSGTPEGEEDERIEITPWPLDEVDAAIAETRDAKTLIALLWLARELTRGRRFD